LVEKAIIKEYSSKGYGNNNLAAKTVADWKAKT